jgi:chromosome segregation ATPase
MTKDSTKKDEAPAKKRTVLTPAQRIEKLKAEAEALEKREAQRAAGKVAQAEANVTVLTERRDQAQAKLDAAEQELHDLRRAAGIEAPSTDEA